MRRGDTTQAGRRALRCTTVVKRKKEMGRRRGGAPFFREPRCCVGLLLRGLLAREEALDEPHAVDGAARRSHLLQSDRHAKLSQGASRERPGGRLGGWLGAGLGRRGRRFGAVRGRSLVAACGLGWRLGGGVGVTRGAFLPAVDIAQVRGLLLAAARRTASKGI